ncbi:putative mitochondrial protein [Hordeum vulgare]|nr:putative mitochondrial protein [Hordeum vulgare]
MYNPHIVARQLGYDQDAPSPLVHGFDSKGIKVWVSGICRRGIASKEYVAWLNDEFVTHQEADRYVRLVDEIGTGSSPLDADTAAGKSGESTMQDNSKRIREEEQLAQEVKTELIVLDRSPCDMDCSATAVKRKNGNRKRRDELSENGDMHKKSTSFASECHEGLQQYDDGPSTLGYSEKNSLQFDGQKSHGLQKDPNCYINKSDELPQPESDD